MIINEVEYNYFFNQNFELISGLTGKTMKPMKWSNGYGMYKLFNNGKSIRVQAHRLVAFMFLGLDLNSKDTVNHKDGDKMNNHPDNLEVVCIEDNIQHAFDTGLAKGKCFRAFIADSKEIGYWFPSIHSSRDMFNVGNVSEALTKGFGILKGFNIISCKI